MSAGSLEGKKSPAEDATTKVTPALSISPEKVCFIVVKAREFDAKDMVTMPDEASNATDDAMMSVLEDHADDPVVAELRGFMGALTEDEQVDLVALAWLGRGDGTLEDWEDQRAEAARLLARPTRRLRRRRICVTSRLCSTKRHSSFALPSGPTRGAWNGAPSWGFRPMWSRARRGRPISSSSAMPARAWIRFGLSIPAALSSRPVRRFWSCRLA